MGTPTPRTNTNTGFLKAMLTRGNVAIVIVILTAAVAVGAYMALQTPGRSAPMPHAAKPVNKGIPAVVAEPAAALRHAEADGGVGPATGRDVPFRKQQTREEVRTRIRDFEADVLDRTRAARVRLETPALKALTADDTAAESDPAAPDKACRAPGYVAFMAGPRAVSDGIYHTMADIARNYFKAFPAAPRVTVSLVVGGGVRDRETFFSNGDGAVHLGGE